MTEQQRFRRFPTGAAVDALAKRFKLPRRPDMQDWQWEVADARRIDEFLAGYESGDLSDDERFTLMEIIIQSFADLSESLSSDLRWSRTLELLTENVSLHLYSIWYWSCLDNDIGHEELWTVTPDLRVVFMAHCYRLM